MQIAPQILEKALELCVDAVTVIDAQLEKPGPRIVYVNQAFEAMTGYSREEVLGRSPGFLQGERSDREVLERLRSALAAGEHFEGETWNYRKSGEAFFLSWTVDPVVDAEGAVTHFVAIQKDVTEQRILRHRLENLERIIGLKKEIVTGGLDLQRVRQSVADAVLRISGADAAVVEEAEGDELVYRAVAGKAEGSHGLRLPIDSSLTGQCFRSREIIKTDDTSQDPRVHQAAARKVGFVSGILVPLVHEWQCYGVLKVYATRPKAFTSDDLELLEVASGILATALFNAASFEHEAQRHSILVDSLPVLVSYVDSECRYREVNAAYENWFGIDARDIRGKHIWDVIGQEAYERLRPYVQAALHGEQISYEVEFPYRHGGSRMVLAQYHPSFRHNEEVSGFYVVAQDLTSIRQAEMDFLTGLLNRRKFEEKANEVLKQAARYARPSSLMFLDIDYFKSINDRFGHNYGDEVLKTIGEHLGNTVRGSDIVGRWGGEEFIILAPETSSTEAILLADRICAEIRRRSFGEPESVTISIGVTRVTKAETLEQAVERADAALYRAKREGRDRVVIAESDAA